MPKLSLTNKYPPYQEYKDSGAEWLGSVPSSWQVQKVVTIFDFSNKKGFEGDFEALSVTYGGIKKQLENAAKVAEGSVRKRVRVGDIVINSRSDRKGAVGESVYDGVVSLVYGVLRPRNKQIVSKYYHYLFRSKSFSEEFYRWGRGIVDDLWTTRANEMKAIFLTIPTKEEQEKIAAFLDEQTARIDETIAKKKRLIELLKEKRTATINQAVTKGLKATVDNKDTILGYIPANWDMLKIKNISKLVTTGGTPNNDPEYFKEEIEWFTPGDFTSPELVDSNRKISNIAVEQGQCKVFPPQSILLVSIGATLGKVGYCENTFSCNQQINVVVPDEKKMLYKYLYYFLSVNTEFLYSNSLVTTMAILNQSKLKNIEILVPPIDEQVEIVEMLENKIPAYSKVISAVDDSIKKLQELKSSLISHAVTGKIKI